MVLQYPVDLPCPKNVVAKCQSGVMFIKPKPHTSKVGGFFVANVAAQHEGNGIWRITCVR
jgi:hypothetical protein